MGCVISVRGCKNKGVITMPGGDRTGPMGSGPMTGRRAGVCAGYSIPGYMNLVGNIPGANQGFGYGRGFGRGFSRGRGVGRNFGWRRAAAPNSYGVSSGNPLYNVPAVSAQDEARALKEEAQVMQEEISAITRRIKELEANSGSEGE